MNTTTIAMWGAQAPQLLPAHVKKPAEIVNYAVQLAQKDRLQIAKAFSSGSYEMATHFVWTKAMSALKKELAAVGLKFLGEMLGKGDLSEAGSPHMIISDGEAIMLAEELGVINGTEAMRLRHVHESLTHFLHMDGSTVDTNGEEMEEYEAVQALKTCVKNILGKEKIAVSTEFAEFRNDLETKVFKVEDAEIRNLVMSPYFFRKITINILMTAAGKSHGAKLENSLANLNVIVPLVWENIKEPERWLVGRGYAEAHDNGDATAAAGIKRALLRVAGFDYVPENLRSSAFVKIAEKLIEAHEGMDNFYNEVGPVKEMQSMGTTIPMPAFASCATALLSVYLGNPYGVSNSAHPVSKALLNGFPENRWEYYFNECFVSDARILNKLNYEKPRNRFYALVKEYAIAGLKLNSSAKKLIDAAASQDAKRTLAAIEVMKKKYYGDKK